MRMMPEEPEPTETHPENRPATLTSSLKERLFRSRTLIISGEIDQDLASNVMALLIAMSNESDQPINMFINSQGGHVESGDTIHDVVRFVRPKVRMIGTGWVASAGALIYLAAERENRYCLPNTRFLLHQPAGGVRGRAADIDIEAREILKMRDRINKIIAEQTGQKLEKIEDDTRRNFWLGADDAVEYGLVGKVVKNVAEIPTE